MADSISNNANAEKTNVLDTFRSIEFFTSKPSQTEVVKVGCPIAATN
ncbi:hypothetical protein JCM19239_6775 [Vibrio variabilis]|uniref:Uncharacterized protein n=1 Tax=Vibrio variabilis TaxID=990271 RepID=A0ABQ0JH24_9VIBR|nr:hypothetical protein JCM19239_6775 [Vibrio variabilis]